ncbi:hypothetical protein N7G274_004127 [Stereocaulon virgatum]|uniref:Uncharacterized protein n=1 Tax=Stereocaulon virgatum TaxID=373712 RepID=A0ABR4AER0_9LECA
MRERSILAPSTNISITKYRMDASESKESRSGFLIHQRSKDGKLVKEMHLTVVAVFLRWLTSIPRYETESRTQSQALWCTRPMFRDVEPVSRFLLCALSSG